MYICRDTGGQSVDDTNRIGAPVAIISLDSSSLPSHDTWIVLDGPAGASERARGWQETVPSWMPLLFWSG